MATNKVWVLMCMQVGEVFLPGAVFMQLNNIRALVA